MLPSGCRSYLLERVRWGPASRLQKAGELVVVEFAEELLRLLTRGGVRRDSKQLRQILPGVSLVEPLPIENRDDGVREALVRVELPKDIVGPRIAMAQYARDSYEDMQVSVVTKA